MPPPEPDDLHLVALQEGTRVTEAAVLVPLVDRSGRVQVLFTQRTAHLDDHAGQISFPGGRVEAGDASREETALRETEEEIGLARGVGRLLGRLPDYEIPSGFRITPVVGWIEPPFALKLDPFEVAAAFEAPLEHFLDDRQLPAPRVPLPRPAPPLHGDPVRGALHLGRDGGHALQPCAACCG